MDATVGSRVTREIYMDDGTWARKGDACLPGTLRHGTVTSVRREQSRVGPWWQTVVEVAWDDGSTGRYLPHGVQHASREAAPTTDTGDPSA